MPKADNKRLKKIIRLARLYDRKTKTHKHTYKEIASRREVSVARVHDILKKSGIKRRPDYLELSGGYRLPIYTLEDIEKKIARKKYLAGERNRRRRKPAGFGKIRRLR
ncbi:MAG: hypothetical protein V1676_04380 [Candidatus Diapherotrites archaeon]